MKVIILCGGKGLRMGSALDGIPKPMYEVNGRPLLWHIMNLYSHYGYNEFILPLGYQGQKIKEYFLNYPWRHTDMSMHLRQNHYELLGVNEDWHITFVETGMEALTGARVKRVEHLIQEDHFMLTYGDGLANINVKRLVEFHQSMGKIVTVTGVKRDSPYGAFTVEYGLATQFVEKPSLNGWVNGGYFVCNKAIFRYLQPDPGCALEETPLQQIAQDGQLAIYEHSGFWLGIDTQKELKLANEQWPAISHPAEGVNEE